jgi:endo-1,4-beta-xylanase
MTSPSTESRSDNCSRTLRGQRNSVARLDSKRTQRRVWIEVALPAVLFLCACADEAASSSPDDGTGGFYYSGTGGSLAAGGNQPGGAAGSPIAAGGYAVGAGGVIGAGGIVVSTGGAIGAGGGTDTGGAVGAGGDTSTGGTIGAGGSTSTGAVTGAGGSNTGGTIGDGGAVGTGGAPGTGGGPPVKFVGNITTRGQVRSDFIDYWDQITPENEGKWGSVEGTRDRMNWAGLDAAYNYAKQHNIPFKQHTFVWGAQQPGWIGGLSQADQRAEVEEWIRLFCERYPDTQMIDVVNEPPPHTTPPYTAALGGAGASGYDWIVQSFKWARQYCPNSILILNDYNTIEYGNDNNHFIDIVQRIKGAGAPIDAVGVQAHAAYNISTNTVKGFLDKIASSTALPVYVSEYDINVADDNRQRSIMEEQVTMFWTNPNVKGITLWGYIVGSTWLTNSGLMSSTGQQRPAMTWLMGYLNR